MDENDATRPDFTGNPEPLEPTVASGQPQEPAQAPVVYVGPPGIGVAGFVCVMVGLVVPFVGIVGLILSVLGYTQAKRESRPYGLALAGMIIGIIVTVLSILVLSLLVFGLHGTVVTHSG
jgi:hypothetical protein